MKISNASMDYQKFQINKNSELILQHGDITQWPGDAIVNAAKPTLLGGGGVDGAIHRAAGPELKKVCEKLPDVDGIRCKTGKAIMTLGFNLPARHIIHTVGPVYTSETKSKPLLISAYKNCLIIANDNEFNNIAFPAISCGIYGYPKVDAAKIAFMTIQENVGNLEEIYFVLFDKPIMKTFTNVAESMFNKIDNIGD